MICRIFNLGKGDETGMHVYLDPETKRRNQELEFSTHTWAVKPLMHPTMQVKNGIARASAAQTVGIVATTAEESGGTGTIDARQESGVPRPANLGSSATNSVLNGNNWTFGSSTLDTQKKTESPGGSLFGSNSAPSSNNASFQLSPRSTLFGTIKSPSALGIFSSSNNLSTNTDTSNPLSGGLFGSNATQADVTSSNNGVSNWTPKGGIFGSNAMFDTDHASKASSMIPFFGAAANSDASKGAPPSTTGFSGFGSSGSTTSKAPTAIANVFSGFGVSSSTTSKASSAKGLFVTNNSSPNSDSSKGPSASSLFGKKAVSSNSDSLNSTSSIPAPGTAGSLASATTDGLFHTNP